MVARVFDPAGFEVSAMRTTSPPMLLGRKLLKKEAIQNDSESVRAGTSTCCARSSRFHRQTLTAIITMCAHKAAMAQPGCTRRSIVHRDARLVSRSTKAIRPTLRDSLRRMKRRRRRSGEERSEGVEGAPSRGAGGDATTGRM